MLSILVHTERSTRLLPGHAVVPVLSDGIRILVRLAMRFPPGGAGSNQGRPTFVSLVKLDANQLVFPVVEPTGLSENGQPIQVINLPRETLQDLRSALDINIQGLPSSASSARFVPHFVLGEISGRTKINWTKDIRLLFGKDKKT